MKIKKTEEIKARVDGTTKAALCRMSDDRGLDLSDVVREAIRDFLSRQPKPALL